MASQIQLRRDTAANWTSVNPTLAQGELGVETDTGKIKLGTGSTAWNSLSYFVGNIAGTTLDAIGDVTITSVQNGDFLRYNGSASAWINDPVNLATDTVGNYVESLVAGTGVTVSNNSGEGATPTVAIGQAVGTSSSVTFAHVAADLTGNVTGNVTGNASTASALQTARSISLGGDLSGSASFDGSQNINITATVQPNSVALGTDTTGNYMSDLTQGTGVTITHTPGEGSNATIAIGQAVATSSSVTFAHVLGDVTGNLTGNASTATALQTPRTISLSGDVSGSVSFDGTSNAEITTTIQPNSIALGTDTSGNYMSSVVAGTGVQVSHTPGEGSEATISIGQDVGTGQSVTFAGATIDAIKIGVTNANTIDTTSGNLTIDSSGGTVTIADNLIVDGTLTVSGSVTVVNTTNLQVGDAIITLNHDETGVPSENAGIEIERGTSANVFLRYNETSDKWELTNDGSVYSTIETASTVGTSLKQQLWLNTVYAATTGILSNSPSYTAGTTDLNGGTGIGAKLAGTTNGTLEVDGAPVPLENRILVKNQANALHNGIYKVTATGSASATWELTRASDFDNSTSGQTIYGKSVRIATGTVNALQVFAVTSAGSLPLNGLEGMIHVIGTDPITWTQVSGKATLIPGNGLQITNNELSLPTINQSNTASTSGATNFINSINVDSYGRLLGVTTNDVLLGLGTNTMGDYVQSVSASAGTGITVSGTGEGAVVSVGSNATPNNTTSAIVMRDGSGNFSAGTITAELSGNASTANALYASKSIGLTGDLSGSVSFNGSQDVVINATIQPNSVALGTDTTGNYINDVTAGTGVTVTHTPSEGSSPTIAIGQAVGTSSSVSFAAVTAPLIGNASTATTLQTARTIAGQSFDGSANINIAPTDLTGVTATASEINILYGANVSTTELNYLVGVSSSVQTQLNAKAPLNSPTFTGTVTLPDNTVALGTKTTGSYVESLVAGTGVTLTNNSGESATPTIAIGQAVGTSSSVTFAHISAPLTGNVTGNVTGSSGSTTGNAATATTLETARTISLTGDVSGSVSFNGSQDVSISATVQPNSVALGTDTTGNYVNDVVAGTGITVTHTPGEGSSPTVAVTANTYDAYGAASSAQSAAQSYADSAIAATNLDGLNNVTVPSPSSGDYLKWNGTAWINDPINLGTDTTGNYINDITAGTGVFVTHTPSEGSSPTVAIGQAVGTSSSVTFAQVETTGSLIVGQNIYVSGSVVTENAVSLALEDPFIYLNNGNTITNPDLGIAGNYNDGTYHHAGVFRDASDGKWKFFDSYQPEPSHPIDTGHASYSAAPVVAEYFESTIATGTAPLTVSSTTEVANLHADTATSLHSSRAISLGGDLSGSVSFDGSSDVTITATIQPNSVALGTDTTGNYMSGITAGTGLTVLHTPGEGSSASVSLNATLDDLSNVTAPTPTDGHFLKYVSASSAWIPAAVPTINALDDIGDVIAPSPGDGDFLRYVSGSAGWVSHTLYLDDISGVDVASPSSGQFLKWNGSKWIADAVPTPSVALDDLTDVAIAPESDGEVIRWNGSTEQWENTKISLSDIVNVSPSPFPSVGDVLQWNGGSWSNSALTLVSALNDLSDVDAASPSNGQFLKYSSTAGAWIPDDVPTISSLDDIGNVVASDPSVGDVLQFDGTQWVPSGTVTTNARTASYTIDVSDNNKLIEMGVGSANNLTVPPNSTAAFPIGSQINILQTGSGQTTVVAGSGVTVNGTPGLKLRAQWSYATLIKRAENTWVLVGDISA